MLNGRTGGPTALRAGWFDNPPTVGHAPIRLDSKRRNGFSTASFEQAIPLAYRHVLSPADFSARVLHEKRRSERSARPLSLVVYGFGGEAGDEPTLVGHLLDALHALTRESDVFGRLPNGSIALLCMDTDEDGMRHVIAKLGARAGSLPFTPVAATYPDQLFDAIAKGLDVRSETDELLASEGTRQSRCGYVGKRALDVTLALVALVLAAPLMLLTALAITVESPGPIIYRQKRLGFGGVPFVFYKFRSMWSGVDDRVHRDFAVQFIKRAEERFESPLKAPTPYKLSADKRITRVGRLIRKTSIDELPQLINVLKGDMSMVGPRPPIPYEAANYESWHLRRVLGVKPGITGLWQVEGRSRVGFNEMVRMDLRYVRDCALWLDLRILMKTVRVVLTCDGAR